MTENANAATEPAAAETQARVGIEEIVARGNRRMTANDLTLLDRSSREIDAKTIVEIGSMDGCSTMVLGRVARDAGGMLYCIEPFPKARWAQNILDLDLKPWVTLVQAASPWIRPSLVPPEPIDFLLIDGDHRCSRAIADYVFWARFVRAGGRIAFHDIDGGKGVALWVRQAVEICERDDNLSCEQGADYKIRLLQRTPPARDRGTIVFEKLGEPSNLKLPGYEP
jgi:predicted O-methyltransferase YrrM